MNRRVSPGRHDLVWCLRRSGWIGLLGLAAFLLLIPFSTAGLPGSSIFNLEVTHDQLKFRLFQEGCIPVILAAALGLGLLTGLSLYRFVREKGESTLFFSLGISRTRLFWNRFLTGSALLLVCVAVPMAVSLGLNRAALGWQKGLGLSCLYLTVCIFLTALFSFLLTAAVSFLSGTLAECLVGWAGFLCAPTLLCYGAGLGLKTLYWGNARGVVTWSGGEEVLPSLLESLSALNPLLAFREELEAHGTWMRSGLSTQPSAISWGRAVLWCCVCAGLALLGWALLRRRAAERAGTPGHSRVLMECVILFTAFPVCCACFACLYPYSAVLAALLGAAAFAGVHVFWRLTLFRSAVRRRWALGSFGVQGAATVVVCLVFATGFFGGTLRFLDRAAVTQASVTYVGDPSLLYGEAGGSTTGTGYYLVGESTVTEQDSLDRVRALQRLFVDSGRREMGCDTGETEDTVVPYDVCFSYTDGSGRQRVWYYDRASFAQLESMLTLEECPEVQEGQTALLTGELEGDGVLWAQRAYREGEVFLSDPLLFNTFQLTMTEDDRETLLAALAADVGELTLEERYFPKEETLAVLMFTLNGVSDCDYFAYHLDNAFVYVTAAWTHTAAWLEQQGLMSLVADTPEIEYIYLQKWDPYLGMNSLSSPMGLWFMAYRGDTWDDFLVEQDFGTPYAVTDADRIAALMPALRDGYYLSRDGWLAAVMIAGESQYRYLFLPADLAPDFVRG